MARETEIYDKFMTYLRTGDVRLLLEVIGIHDSIHGAPVRSAAPAATVGAATVPATGGATTNPVSNIKIGASMKKYMEASAGLRKAYDNWKKKFNEEGTLPDAKLDWHFTDDFKLLLAVLVALDQYFDVVFHGESERFLSQGNQPKAAPELVSSYRLKEILMAIYTDAGGHSKQYVKNAGTSGNFTHKQVDDLLKDVFERFRPK